MKDLYFFTIKYNLSFMCVFGKPSVKKQFYTSLPLWFMPRYNLISDWSVMITWHDYWPLIGCGCPGGMWMLTAAPNVLLSSSKCPPSVLHCHSMTLSSPLIGLLHCLQASDWSGLITWPQCWPPIGWQTHNLSGLWSSASKSSAAVITSYKEKIGSE